MIGSWCMIVEDIGVVVLRFVAENGPCSLEHGFVLLKRTLCTL